MTTIPLPLVDRFGRRHTSLRVSVTDRCNIRCFYCMPEHGIQFLPRSELLTFEEIDRLVGLMVERFGVDDVRITGGEPLVRRDLTRLISMLARRQGIRDLSLTTNGILLSEVSDELRAAGLKRLNISLDTLDEDVFQRLTRRTGLERVLAGIESATKAGFKSIKLNTLAIKGVAESELVRLVEYAKDRGCLLRFIEWMPLDADRNWDLEQVLTGDEILSRLAQHFGPVTPIQRDDASRPAERFRIGDVTVGIIRSVTQPFCHHCNRLRLTAEGAMRNCLFAQDETDLRGPLRGGQTDDEIDALIRKCVQSKRAGHGIDDPSFRPPDRTMHSIGG